LAQWLSNGGIEPDVEVELSTRNLISIIDDDEGMREAIRGLMRSLGFAVAVFPSGVDFLAYSNFRETSCLIADVQMTGMTGIELYSRLKESGNAIPTILITAYPDDSVRTRVLADGVICYLSKPFDDDDLLGCINSALMRTYPTEGHA
jgi:FixJ family two-component response regulator